MTEKNWMLSGTFYECCRTNGHCPLWFGRDLTDGPCVNLATYSVTEGQIQGVDMKGVIFTYHGDGIGPKASDLAPDKKGVAECAVYIGDKVTDEQKKILEPFLSTQMMASRSQKFLGARFCDLKITEENGVIRIINPYCEQHLALTTGKDRQTPIRMENPRNPGLSNVKFCNTLSWKYTDFSKTIEYKMTSGAMADFKFSGTI